MTRKHSGFLAVLTAAILWSLAGAGLVAVSSQTANTVSEGFEAGGKPAYAAGSVSLGSGNWTLDDALLGNTASDRKTGSYSARVRNAGKLTMNFNAPSAGGISIGHAVYGTDGASGWELWKSSDNGLTWTRVGSPVTSTSTTLSNASFTVNSSTAARFEIRKVSGGTNRINIDNIVVTSYVAATPTPTPTATPTPTVTPTPAPTPPVRTGVHLTMGNPSNAVVSVNQPTNYLMEKPQYALSYNRDNGTPNWTSWHLDSSWLGSTSRQDDFRPDATLPSGWYRVTASDYSGSGYDRGHMTPSGDRTSSTANNSATFLMTNMVPQAPNNNQQSWASLENYCRTLTSAGNELYIVSGGHGVSGYIANGRVAIPTTTWKVIIVLPTGTNDAARVTTATRVIAVSIPNNNNVASDWKQYRTSADYVEQMTGYDFFSNVPVSVQSVIESRIDTQ